MNKNDFLNYEFIALCIITFLAICNVSVFFNFHLYLQHLGFGGKAAGFIIGIYSLAAMALYLTVSRHIRLSNALSCMMAGILIVAGCGIAYLYADRFWPLVILRMANGAGLFLVMAACMVILVAILPPEKTGMGFSLYSVALLSPYSIMPAVTELVSPMIDSPTKIYMATGILMLTAASMIFGMQRRLVFRMEISGSKSKEVLGPGEERKNLFRKPVINILLVNSLYFTLFSALFFLFEGYGVKNGMENPGFFFTIQMGVMVVIRLFGGRIFDTVSKVGMVIAALIATGAGFALLLWLPDPAWILPIAIVFGLGMGLCVPPLNSLMYLVTRPRYRGYNANMMMLTVHVGSFLGPFAGAWIIDVSGYDRFLGIALLMTLGAAGFFFIANPEKEIGPRPL